MSGEPLTDEELQILYAHPQTSSAAMTLVFGAQDGKTIGEIRDELRVMLKQVSPGRPMTPELERLARVLCARHYADRFGKPVDDQHVQMNVDGNWQRFADDVRALLTALHEPDEMILARVIHPLNVGPFNQFKDQWRLYIDHILGEK